MSTTRWIIETPCEHGEMVFHQWGDGKRIHSCDGGSRSVVDPDNLPPEAIQRAAEAMADLTGCAAPLNGADFCPACGSDAEAIITAFLSDPEPGDQT